MPQFYRRKFNCLLDILLSSSRCLYAIMDIFLSYSSEDRDRVRLLVQRLGELGWSVWWDRRIPPGMTWPQMIEKALESSRMMVVVWSKVSIKSKWVLIEANEGEDRYPLVPVYIDVVKPPLQFRLVQAADLTSWDGSKTHEEFSSLAARLMNILGDDVSKSENSNSRKPLKSTTNRGGSKNVGKAPDVNRLDEVSDSKAPQRFAVDHSPVGFEMIDVKGVKSVEASMQLYKSTL